MDEDHRTPRPQTSGERATLTAFLDFHRDTLEWKCAGLGVEQLREQALPPSELSLLGLVRHMAEVERFWFRVALSGDGEPRPRSESGPYAYAEFDVAAADPEQAFAAWRAACAYSREVVDGFDSLDTQVHWHEHVLSIRYVLTHLIEEYARHNGHADLLRERLDGATGE